MDTTTNAMIFKMLDISTGNLTQKTCTEWFPSELARDGVEIVPNKYDLPLTYTSPIRIYQKGEYGWFVHVNSNWKDSTPENPFEPSVPADLRAVLEYAARLECDWIQFDRDADVNPDLPSFDW